MREPINQPQLATQGHAPLETELVEKLRLIRLALIHHHPSFRCLQP